MPKASKRSCNPSEYDILCGKDKTYSKHTGNRLFRERIDAMKLPYASAPTKQEKMVITKNIVTFMQAEHGSRFLKMEGSTWVEINNQAARDKVSHALRFAARNLKSSATTGGGANNTKPASPSGGRRRRMLQQTDDNSSTTSSSNRSVSTESEGAAADDEPVPFSQIFGHNFAIAGAQEPRFQAGMLADHTAPPLVAQSPRHHEYSISAAPSSTNQQQHEAAAEEEDFVAFTRHSFRSMQLDQNRRQQQQQGEEDEQPFDTLRSADLREILNEPLEIDEWEVVAQLAEC